MFKQFKHKRSVSMNKLLLALVGSVMLVSMVSTVEARRGENCRTNSCKPKRHCKPKCAPCEQPVINETCNKFTVTRKVWCPQPDVEECVDVPYVEYDDVCETQSVPRIVYDECPKTSKCPRIAYRKETKMVHQQPVLVEVRDNLVLQEAG